MCSNGNTIIFLILAISLGHECWCARWRRFKVTSRLRRRTETEVWNHQSYALISKYEYLGFGDIFSDNYLTKQKPNLCLYTILLQGGTKA